MKPQSCRFFELAVRRPAFRMRSRCCGEIGSSANWRTTRTVLIAFQVSIGPNLIESPLAVPRPYLVNAPSPFGARCGRGMNTELVVRAQKGDEGAFASLAVAAGDRLHAVAHRILRDIELAEDATQQALLAIWRDLPQLRDPARFDAWSYRLLLRACYAEGRRSRQWTPNLRLLHTGEPMQPDGSTAVIDRDQLERVVRSWLDEGVTQLPDRILDAVLDQVPATPQSRAIWWPVRRLAVMNSALK